MKKLSRSEIEKSIKRSSRTSGNINSRKDPVPFEDGKFNPRQSVILGGNLSGVKAPSSNKKYLWWLAAFSLLLFSSLIFIIPALTENSPKLAKAKQKQISDDKVYQQTLANEQANGSSDLSKDVFTVKNDRLRAEEYRLADQKNDEKIAQYTRLAQATQKAGKYTQPDNDNAYYYYNKILQLDKNNRFAKKGVAYITSRLTAVGLNEAKNGELDKARNTLASLMLIDSDSENFAELAEAITQLETQQQNQAEQQQEIDSLLKQAQSAFDSKKMTLPDNDNALYFYQQILAIQPDNNAAKQGINNLIKYFDDKATLQIDNQEWQDAKSSINKISLIDEQSPSIQQLTTKLNLAEEKSKQLTKSVEQERAAITTNNQAQAAAPSANASSSKSSVASNNSLPAVEEKSKPVSQTTQVENFSRPAPVEDITETTNANLISNNSQLKLGLQAYYNSEYITAFNALKPLADTNNTRAKIRIGYMYQFGRGTNQNTELASQYFNTALPNLRKLANQNQSWAQADLGSLYEDGIVVTQSYPEALKWYRKAAAKNYTGAQTNLGNMYFFGKGVEQNQEEAIRWYRLAALGGDAIAKQNLIQLGAVNF